MKRVSITMKNMPMLGVLREREFMVLKRLEEVVVST